MEAKDVIVTVEMSLEDLGRISIALDRMWEHHADRELDPQYGPLQLKWDALYRGLHNARIKGLVGYKGGV